MMKRLSICNKTIFLKISSLVILFLFAPALYSGAIPSASQSLGVFAHLSYFAILTCALFRFFNHKIVPTFLTGCCLALLGEALGAPIGLQEPKIVMIVAAGLGVTCACSLMGLMSADSRALQRYAVPGNHDHRARRISDPLSGRFRLIPCENRSTVQF